MAIAPSAAHSAPRPQGRTSTGRILHDFPTDRRRWGYLLVTALATVVLYYESFASGSVAASVLSHYDMTFRFYVNITVVGFLLGATTAVAAGVADRWGRVNLIVAGLAVVGVLVAFVQPHMPDKWSYAAVAIVVGLVEGIVLVATPALMRDFSAQWGRGAAMSLWTLGPVLGSLAASAVSSSTLPHLPAWQDQFTIAGIAGLVMSVLAWFGLRELAPELRHQLMVSLRDRTLLRARAAGVDVAGDLAHPWRQMVTGRILASSFAISVFLMFYYAIVGFLVIYLVLNFGYDEHRANSLGNWFWAAMALSLVVVGVASDRLRVRKPFMLVGAVGAAGMTIIFLQFASRPGIGFGQLAAVMALIAVFLGMAYVPWMAAYTESVEARNPALVATGLAIWGGVLRVVSAAFLFVVPFIVTSVTPLSEHGPQIQELTAKYSQQVLTAEAIEPATLTALIADQGDQAAIGAATTQVAAGLHVSTLAALLRLKALADVPTADLQVLYQYGPEVIAAREAGPGQWQRMWWVTIGGQILFVPLIFALSGPWNPRRARREAQQHERWVTEQLAALQDA